MYILYTQLVVVATSHVHLTCRNGLFQPLEVALTVTGIACELASQLTTLCAVSLRIKLHAFVLLH